MRRDRGPVLIAGSTAVVSCGLLAAAIYASEATTTDAGSRSVQTDGDIPAAATAQAALIRRSGPVLPQWTVHGRPPISD